MKQNSVNFNFFNATKPICSRQLTINTIQMKIKKFLIVLVFITGSITSANEVSAQTDPSTYEIPPFTYGEQVEIDLHKAIGEADMDIYRLRNKRRELNFNNRGVVILYSAEELKQKGMKIDPLNYPEDVPSGYKEPVYVLSEDGKLIQLFEPQNAGKK